ncbi:MAG: FAD-binding oxidoreductase [Candidatus Sifarchaeia archaeon]|jgi:glycolate oxidase
MGQEMMDKEIIRELAKIVGEDYITTDDADLVAYSSDVLSSAFKKPDCVVMPENVQQISEILRLANDKMIPVIARGGGTSELGGCVAWQGGIILELRRMNKIKNIDADNLMAVVEPGVICEKLNSEARKYGITFPPTVPTESVATIGGMVASNSSGLRSAKYGATTDYVLALEVVLADGRVIRVGKPVYKTSSGYDLVHLFVGSEGTLGIITEITLKLKPIPKYFATAYGLFDSLEESARVVAEIIKSGITPAGLEIVDLPTQQAVNELAKKQGGKLSEVSFPEAEGLLLFELDGRDPAQVEADKKVLQEIAKKNGCKEIIWAKNEEERERMWFARKSVLVTLVRDQPTILIGDVILPPSKLPDLIRIMQKAGENYDIRVYIIAHAADGNAHYLIPYNINDEDELRRLDALEDEIVHKTIELGGSVSGEHGIGQHRMKYMENEHKDSIDVMRAIKQLFDPNNILCPGTVIPG